ncbi:YtxH domain-containing protein [Thermoactinomyces sp. DSM 45892]|uniref:YtxH domain-containing protein n=1 Tax=Thermoactinomyces sp. DSM 45892 TaxID=1882753 RepID=UPI000894DA2C|nr:YtxH domain-containing protein [Thermoactinomyces sp. DSM 45892]SDY26899.1 Gas vesicle protein [Thermoactinomyces sp. DSM 45892]
MSEKKGMNVSEFMVGAVIGGIIGAAVALLTTPKTGKEMREDLKEGLEVAKDKSSELVHAVKSQTGDAFEKMGDAGTKVQSKWIEIKESMDKDRI